MSKRIVKSTPSVPPGAELTRGQAAELASEIVALQIQQEQTIAKRDAAVLEATAPFATDLDQLEKAIESGFDRLENWANAHPEEFARAESVLLSGHRVGWRLGNYAAKLRSKWTWAKVLAALGETGRALRERWTRERVDLNKEAMIADRETHATQLAAVGVQIVQERRFYLDPAREGQAEPLITRDAA